MIDRSPGARCGSLRGVWDHHHTHTPLCEKCRPYHREWQHDYRKRVYLTGPQLISGLGTRRRLQALARLGWSYGQLGELLGGVSERAVGNIVTRPERSVHQATAAKVAAVYDRLQATPGPSRMAVDRAKKKGWAAPLDWDDIDNPDEVPACEIERAHGEALEMERARRLEDRRARKRDATRRCRERQQQRKAA